MSQVTPLTIIGAGLGGLTLARVLHVHGIAESARLSTLLFDDSAPQGLLDFFAGASTRAQAR